MGMQTSMKLLTLFLCASAAFGADFLPLQLGNYWTYRDSTSGQTFTIRVGTPVALRDGRVFSRIDGYVNDDLWVRTAENGSILQLDEETGNEYLLTPFDVAAPIWGNAPSRGCEHEVQLAEKQEPYSGPAGYFADAKTLNYRTFSCADTGILSEVYVENIGLVRRTVQTIAGPRVLELAEARVGNFTFIGSPAASFDASLSEVEPGKLRAYLRLILPVGEAIHLIYADSQDYDVALWDSNGDQIYKWSDGKAFAQGERSRRVPGRLTQEVEIDLREPLPDGHYLMEAWLTAGPARRSFAAMTPVRVVDGKLVR